jgi:Tol biopolymer transport system component
MQLWLHALDTGTARPLPGTDDVLVPTPCWSPDGKSIAYFAGNALKRLDLESGVIQVLVPASLGRGCTWNREGTILFGMGDQRAIFRTSDQPGVRPQPATPLTTVITALPDFLPDGRHFLYFAYGEGLYLGELGGGPPTRLVEADSSGIYSPAGYIVYVREQTLVAHRFDPDTLTLSGDPVTLTGPVGLEIYQPPVSASASGSLIFRSGLEGGEVRQFTWFDRSGKVLETVAKPVTLAGSPPVLSPDGRSIAFDRATNGNTDIWLMDVATGALSQVTAPPGLHVYPVFSPDNRSLYLASNKTGVFEMYERPITGSTEDKLVMPRAMPRLPREVSRDGRFMLYRAGSNIAAIQLDGNPRAEFPVVEMTVLARAEWPQFSPDSRWIVFHSTESGKLEVYVQQFPSGRRLKVSKSGGFWPRWSGKEIFYISPENELVAVPIELAEDPQQTKVGEPATLFAPPVTITVSDGITGPSYMVSDDGQRFLIPAWIEVKSPITVIKNWKP